jgi:hypothetical protein
MTPKKVAEWMLSELERVKFLHQETVVYAIASNFGKEFTYINQNGNLAIRKDVLDAFKKITGDDVIWESGERMWRKRQSYDRPGRQQY